MNAVCIVCRSSDAASHAHDRFRSLLNLPPFAEELQLTTRYYSATIYIDLVHDLVCAGESLCAGETRKNCASLTSLQRCQAVVLFAADFGESLVDVKDLWALVRNDVGEDCVRLLVIDGRIESDNALMRLLHWSVEAHIEILCDDNCDESMSVAERLSDALCSAYWPIKSLSTGTKEVGVSPKHVENAGDPGKEQEKELVLRGNRVRKPMLRSDVDVLTQALLELDGSSDEDDAG
jgi:hypothetical protein